jgi:RNA polymerase sigma-70 factor (ECF subfamily)
MTLRFLGRGLIGSPGRRTVTSTTPGELNADELLRALHDEHGAALWHFVLGLTSGDRPRAEDIVQETMLRAWRNPAALDGHHGSPRAWLFTVARRIVIDEWRSPRRRVEVVTAEVPETSSPDGTDRILQSWLVADALQELSEDHRRVIVECYYRGRSIAEAAQVLGIAEGTVKSRCHYAVRSLAIALQERGVTSRG